MGCGQEGRIEIGSSRSTPSSKIFPYSGHNPRTGVYYVSCPSCGADLSVYRAESGNKIGFPTSFDSAIQGDTVATSSRITWWVPLWWIGYISAFTVLSILIIRTLL
jgi:hypothetical protein